MSEPIYVQCTLQRMIPLEHGLMTRTTVAWLPARFGRVGKTVRLVDDKADWTVTETGHRTTAKDLERRSRDHKNQRKASDI